MNKCTFANPDPKAAIHDQIDEHETFIESYQTVRVKTLRITRTWLCAACGTLWTEYNPVNKVTL